MSTKKDSPYDGQSAASDTNFTNAGRTDLTNHSSGVSDTDGADFAGTDYSTKATPSRDYLTDDFGSDDGQPNAAASSPEIRASLKDIDQTRSNIGDTLEAIKEKLDPKMLMDEAKDRVNEVANNVMEKAKDTVHHAVTDARVSAKDAVTDAVDTAKEAVTGAVSDAVDSVKGAGTSVIDMIKRNPVPAAVIGIAGLWLFLQKRQQGRSGGYGEAYGDSGAYTNGMGYNEYASANSEHQHGIRERLGDVTETVRDKASHAADAVREKASHAAEAVGDMVGSARERVSTAAGHTVETAKDLGETVYDAIRANPVPAALACTGITWLVMASRGGQTNGNGGAVGKRYYDSRGQIDRNPIADPSEDGGEGVGEWASDKLGAVKDRATEWGSNAWEHTTEVTSNATTALQRSFSANPIPIGLAAIGLGAAIGLLLPQSERENMWMGEARDRIVDTASEKVQDIKEKVSRVAEETVDMAKETAKEMARTEGLTTV